MNLALEFYRALNLLSMSYECLVAMFRLNGLVVTIQLTYD